MIIGISGKAQHGKDTIGKFLAQELNKKKGITCVLMAYANELKNMVQKYFDLSYEQLWGSEKEVSDKRYIKPVDYDYDRDNPPYWTAREIMQSFGEYFRSVDYNFWVKHLFKIIDEKEYEHVIITDCRYPNEVNPVFERNGYHVRIHRDLDLDTHGKEHSSETSLDGKFKIDFEVENNGTMDELKKTASDIADAILEMERLKEAVAE